MPIILLVVGIFLFVCLVIIHEFGHYVVAKRNGVEVEEFGIFFPPHLYRHKTKSGMIFSINLIPLGGFVKLKGEHDADNQPGSFGAASTWVKVKILLAGVFMNLLAALVLLTILSLIGLPQLISNQFNVKSNAQTINGETIINYVEKKSPAQKAGLKVDDQIVAIGRVNHLITVKNPAQLANLTRSLAGQKVQLIYRGPNNHLHYASTTLLTTAVVQQSDLAYIKAYNQAKACQVVQPPKAFLGVEPVSYNLNRYSWAAPIEAIGLSAQTTALTFQGIGNALYGLGSIVSGFVTNNSVARQNGECQASSQVSGPVGIYFILKQSSFLGYQFMLMIIALISLTLAIMNVLPIPALDGGRFWLILLFRLFKKPLKPKTEETINAIGFVILIILIILVTNVDIQHYLVK